MHLIGYIFVQFSCAAVDLFIFFLLTNFAELLPLIANIVSKCIGVSLAFFMLRNLFIATPNSQRIYWHMTKYFISFGANIVLSTAILALLVSTGTGAFLSKVITDVITLIVFFFISRSLIFK